MTRTDEGKDSELNALIENADTIFALFAAVGGVTSTFGFTHFTLMDMPTDNTAPAQSLIHFTSLPHPFITAADHAALLQDSAAVPPEHNAPSHIEWNGEALCSTDACAQGLAPRLKAMHINMGVTFAAPRGQQETAALLLFGNRAPLSETERAAIAALVRRIVERFEELRPGSAPPPRPLSSRELEVIRWTAEGKTSHEIGKILSLSDHTINAYLANAIRKLECVNRTQLVAKALRLRLIE